VRAGDVRSSVCDFATRVPLLRGAGEGTLRGARGGCLWRAVPMKDVAKRRHASGSRWRAGIRGSPNGATRRPTRPSPAGERIARGGAPGELKHLSTPRKREHPRSSGERNGASPNRHRAKAAAVAVAGLQEGPDRSAGRSGSCRKRAPTRRALERPAGGGESPVGERRASPGPILSTAGHVESGRKPGGPPPKAKDAARPIAHQYREGKVKSTPARGVKEILKPRVHTPSEPGDRRRRTFCRTGRRVASRRRG
jgi:hypothetical protein